MPLPTAIKPQKPLSSFFSVETDPNGPILVVIHGRPKSGKTTLAASASKFFPAAGPAKLSDMLFLLADSDGLGGLDAQGIVAPRINLLDLWGEYGFRKGNIVLRDQLDTILTSHPEIETISVSSLTSFDVEANAEYYDRQGADVDSYSAFRQILGEHRMLLSALARSGCNIILECHSVSASVGDAASEKKKETLRMVGGGSILPDLTGKAHAIYARHNALQLAIIAKTAAGKKHIDRTVHTVETADMAAGSRYEKFLDPTEPFDLHAILDKIRKAKEGEKK